MPIDDIRAKQKADQTQAIKSRLESGSIVRIGNRLPITGRYEVLESDGGISNNGVKVYNAQEQYGDRVLAYPRLDGTIALDSEKGSIVRPPTAFPVCPGYLAGQVFNCEEPKKKKVENFWVLFSLGGKMFVGGHRAVPEMIYDPKPQDEPLNQNFSSGYNIHQIWGDAKGWEASFAVGTSSSVFATSSGTKKYSLNNDGMPFAFALYGGQHLGKGLFIYNYDFVQSPNYGQTGVGVDYSQFRSWKNAILDIDAVSVGDGRDSQSGTRGEIPYVSPGDGSGLIGTDFRDKLTHFPPPYSSKTENYKYSGDYLFNQTESQRSFAYEEEVDSHTIMFRDRTFSLFYRANYFFSSTQTANTGPGILTVNVGPTRVTDFILSDGVKDTVLFSVTNIQDYTFNNSRQFALFGASPQDFNQASTDSYKLNSPSVTQVQRRSELLTHLNTLRSYDVKVFSILSKASLFDGVHTVEKVDAWGIPIGSRILDVAAWVP